MLSFARRAAAYANRRRREFGPRLRAALILHRYSAHYRHAARVYRRETGATGAPRWGRVSDVGVRVVTTSTPDLGLTLPPGFASMVQTVARGAAAALDRTADCDFFPPLPPGPLPERTPDIPALAAGQVITVKLRDPLALDGVRELGEPLLEQLERNVFGAYLVADKVYVYRSPISRQAPDKSWLWHFDNHPRELLKVMVYLTDVGEDTAPFEYLRERASGRAVAGRPLTPLLGDSRVPASQIARQLAAGCESRLVTGPAGTVLVFDDNVVHRATLARAAHRDVIVFQIRPVPFKASPRIDPRWTGSFGHRDFNPNPWQVASEIRFPRGQGRR